MARKKRKKSGPKVRKLRRPIQRHLGVELNQAECISHTIEPVRRVNIHRVIDRWANEQDPPVHAVGFSSTGYFREHRLLQYLITDELIQAPVEREQLECAPGEFLDCVQSGLYLLKRGKVPVVLALRPGEFSSDPPAVDVIAGTREAARDTLQALLDEAQRNSVYRGRTIVLEAGRHSEGVTVRFQTLRPTAREDLVLPAELITVVERNVIGLLKHGEALRASGRGLRHGMLLHGAPGTGKTMMIRSLAQSCPDHTVILLDNPQPGLVRHACHIARLLAPTLVVMEDVDLVAVDRDRGGHTVVLHELLNEMDGLGEQAEVIFLLTTNRPDVLEPALSARPGRIDQAVEFPLPDADCRRRLFEVYGQGLDLTAVDVPRWVGQTDGVSPAFIEELLRKAALLAAERGEESRPMRLTDADVQNAVRELVVFGGEMTQKLLGYRTGRFGLAAGRP